MRFVRILSVLVTLFLFLVWPSVLVAGSTPSSVALVALPTSSTLGQTISLTANVLPSDATGTVTFYDSVNLLGIEPLSGGDAVLITSQLSSGRHLLHVYYSGDGSYAPSTSSPVEQIVTAIPSSGFLPPTVIPMGNWATSVAVGDFNGDGIADLAVSIMDYEGGPTPDGVSVLLGNGDGTFTEMPHVSMGVHPQFVAIADFNGDGKPDLVTADWGSFQSGTTVTVALGNGDGTFGLPQSFATGGIAPWSLAVGDFNADGKADLAVANELSGTVSVLLGNGDGTFQPAVPYPVQDHPLYVVSGDFNGDGIPDLAVTNEYSDSVSVLLGNGDGTFQAAQNYSAGHNPVPIVLGDFNGDGRTDVAVGVYGFEAGNTVNALLSNLDGSLQLPLSSTTGVAPRAIATGDFNGDGIADLVVGNWDTNDITVLFGNGNGTFQPPVSYPDGGGPDGIAVGDFNNDGATDFVVANVNSNNILVFLALHPTTTALVSSLNPAYVGQSVMLTATVSPTTATGTVTFYDGATALGTSAVTAGTATLTPAAWTVGVHPLSAVYSGDASDAGSTSATLNQTILALTSTTTWLVSAPNPAVYGHAVHLTANVLPVTATGSVTFYDGAAVLGVVALSSGAAKMSVSDLTAGVHTLTAVYGGDVADAASTSPNVAQMVTIAATVTHLKSSKNPSLAGESITLHARVSPAGATGTVTFYDGSLSLGTVALSSGKASLSISTLSVGSHALTAVYSGDPNHAASTSDVLTQMVNAVATSTILTSSPNPSRLGKTVKLTAKVTPRTATGTVTFYDGTNVLGSAPLANGTATLSVSTFTTGAHSLTAVYAGDANNLGSTSEVLTQTVM